MKFCAIRLIGIAALILLAPLAAVAQIDPITASDGPASDDQTIQIRGHVSSFDGAYALVVRDEQGYLDNVQLHDGTVISPTGMTLAPGMVVSVIGYNDGATIGANEVDTPYAVYGGTPFFEGHPWTYFGAGVALGVFFSTPAWWHGSSFGGGYRFVDGHRYWAHVDRERLFRGGAFHGRDYIVDAHRGGWSGRGDPRVLGHYEHRAPETMHATDHHVPERRPAEHGFAEHGLAGHDTVDVHGRPVTMHGGPSSNIHGFSGAPQRIGVPGGERPAGSHPTYVGSAPHAPPVAHTVTMARPLPARPAPAAPHKP